MIIFLYVIWLTSVDGLKMTSTEEPKKVIVFGLTDLLLLAKIEGIAAATGSRMVVSNSLEDLSTIFERYQRSILVCDLISSKQILGPLSRLASRNGTRILGFYPHVNSAIRTFAES